MDKVFGFLSGFSRFTTALPLIMTGIEKFRGPKTGAQKKIDILDATELMLSVGEFVANKELVDEKLLREGIDQMIEGQHKVLKAVKAIG